MVPTTCASSLVVVEESVFEVVVPEVVETWSPVSEVVDTMVDKLVVLAADILVLVVASVLDEKPGDGSGSATITSLVLALVVVVKFVVLTLVVDVVVVAAAAFVSLTCTSDTTTCTPKADDKLP
jgi:hypothetical protein